MKKITIVLFLSLLTFNYTNAQKLKGNKNVTIENREIEPFSAILLKGKINVVFQESPMGKVTVETDENLQSAVETRVIDGVLEVYLSQEIKSKKALNITIGVTDSIQRIEARDKVKITSEDEIHTIETEIIALENASIQLQLKSKKLSIVGEDKSKFDLNVNVVETLNIALQTKSYLKMQSNALTIIASLKDSSSIKYEGICKDITINAEGSGSIKGKDLLVDNATIKATGRSNITINTAKKLKLYTDGSVIINLYDNPQIVIEKFAGKSTLRKK